MMTIKLNSSPFDAAKAGTKSNAIRRPATRVQ